MARPSGELFDVTPDGFSLGYFLLCIASTPHEVLPLVLRSSSSCNVAQAILLDTFCSAGLSTLDRLRFTGMMSMYDSSMASLLNFIRRQIKDAVDVGMFARLCEQATVGTPLLCHAFFATLRG